MDYSGHMPKEQAVRLLFGEQTPVQRLTDDILEKSLQARVYVVDHLLKNPGVLATFDQFEVEFEDMTMETESLRDLDQTVITVSQVVRIRRKKEEDDTGIALGGDSRGEARPD